MDFHPTETYFTVDHLHPLPLLLVLIVSIIPFWQIFRKVGFSGALSLLLFIPVINVILLYVVGFSKRPSRLD